MHSSHIYFMKGGIYMTIFYKFILKTKCLCVLLSVFTIIFSFNETANTICLASTINETETASTNEAISMYSGSYALIDGDTGRILIGKEADIPMANASTTKILTCIVALESCNMEDILTISANASSQPKVRLGMKEGETYPLKDMLYGLMLESYNDCAVAIAEHVSGNVKEFSKKMNAKAKEIGCKDTYFITPNGLDAEDEMGFHHTTAEDLCKIMAYCTWQSSMKEEFLKITQTRNYQGSSNGKEYSFTNHNAFLNQMEGVLSGKTGFTNQAGYCYVAAMETNGEKYCIALLACGWPNNKNYKWKDARTLFEYGMENYNIKKIKLKETVFDNKVNGYVGEKQFSKLNQLDILDVLLSEKEYKMLLSKKDTIKSKVVLKKDINLPIKKGQKMGVCNLYIDDILLDSIPLIASDNVNMWGIKDVVYTIFYQFLTFSL